jgi:threonine-phosphate decarboxylase
MRRYEHGGDIHADNGIFLDFSVNTNPLGMPESVKRAIIDHIPEYASYPDSSCRALRSALAARYGLEASMVLCGNGAAELIFVLCAGIKPRRAVTLAPAFSEYERSAALFGGKVYEHRLLEADGFALTESILEELAPGADMLFLCNPNNPTGRLTDPALLCKIAEVCRNNGTLLILDECFIDFTRGKSMLPQLKDYPNLLILQAFTKIYAMAGLRLGALYCADGRLLSRIADFSPAWNVSGVAQAAGITALKENDWIENTRRLVENERAFMTSALGGLGLTVYQSDSNFLLIKSERPLYMPLRARGILVRPCANFTGLDERHIRIGLKTHDENLALLRAVSEVLNG